MQLRTKIPLLLTPLVVAPLLLLGALAYHKLEQVTLSDFLHRGRGKIEDARALLERDVEEAATSLDLMAGNVLLQRYAVIEDAADRYSLAQSPLLDLFRTTLDAFHGHSEVRYFLPDGFEDSRLTHPYVPNRRDDDAHSPPFRGLVASTAPHYATVYLNEDTGEPALFVGRAVAVRDPAEDPIAEPPRLRGYLAVTHDLDDIETLVAQTRIGQRGFLFATSADGTVLFPRAATARPQLPGGFAASMPALLTAATPTELTMAGETMLVSGAAVAPNLLVFSAVPRSEFDALRREAQAVVLAVVLFAVFVTVGALTTALAALVVRPVRRLQRLAADIGRGHWDVRADIAATDEIGQLGRAFEDMARNLGQADDRVRFLAYHDNLTGLPNREMFREYLNRALAQARRAETRLAVLFLDIDGFKRINDTLGHQAGDALLQEVARRLSERLREEDMIMRTDDHAGEEDLLARLGGDEFIVLLTGLRDVHAPGVVARRFIRTLGEAIVLDGQDCYIGASIGIALYPDDGVDSGDLIKHADIAMYHAKEMGKNSYQYFQTSMNAAIVERAALESRLRRAIDDGQLSLMYQPKVDPGRGCVVGFEALMRWTDPDAGPVSPGTFIPLAEETGLILPMGEWAIHEVCRQVREWRDAGLAVSTVSVNVSPVQFERQDVGRIVADALARHGLAGTCLEVEITESAIMANAERALRALGDLKAADVGVALDDFGTGYSSLSYLRRFTIDTLKIDRSFIRNIDSSREDAEVVGAIVAMAHTLGLRVVVEGIETEAQLAVVVERGCDVVQGYVFHRPLSPAEVALLLRAPLRLSA